MTSSIFFVVVVSLKLSFNVYLVHLGFCNLSFIITIICMLINPVILYSLLAFVSFQ